MDTCQSVPIRAGMTCHSAINSVTSACASGPYSALLNQQYNVDTGEYFHYSFTELDLSKIFSIVKKYQITRAIRPQITR